VYSNAMDKKQGDINIKIEDERIAFGDMTNKSMFHNLG